MGNLHKIDPNGLIIYFIPPGKKASQHVSPCFDFIIACFVLVSPMVSPMVSPIQARCHNRNTHLQISFSVDQL